MAALGHSSGKVDGARRTLVIGAGGSGVLAVTHLKALHISRFGGLRAGTRLLGFDVMEVPITASGPRTTGDPEPPSTRLEPGIEYFQIGRDCDPTRLSQLMRARQQVNGDLRALIQLQPDGRFTKSLQTGTEGERLYGYLAFTWSAGEVRRALSMVLRSLNDLRLPGEQPGAMSLQVVVIFSVAGGVGSSIALPLCREVKRTMDRLGMDVNQSTFIGLGFTPDCFPETVLRLSNAAETLRDFNSAQKEAIIP
jgi:hypothetical protein